MYLQTMIAPLRPKELEIVSLELPGNEDSEYVFNYCSKSVNQTAMQNIFLSVHKKSV
jgi:hypothetical protein